MSKLNWNNLNKEEKAEYMRFQMSPCGGGNNWNMPEGCHECGACGGVAAYHGWCFNCNERFGFLRDKLEGKTK